MSAATVIIKGSGNPDVRLPGGNLNEKLLITNRSDCAAFRTQVDSFDLGLSRYHGDQDGILLGAVKSVHCSHCYQFHFIAIAVDDWMVAVEHEGEPLDAEAAAVALLEYHLSRITLQVV